MASLLFSKDDLEPTMWKLRLTKMPEFELASELTQALEYAAKLYLK